jgi:hypothetical protein
MLSFLGGRMLALDLTWLVEKMRLTLISSGFRAEPDGWLDG